MHLGNRKYHLNCSQNRKIPDKVYIGWSARFPVTPNEPKWPRSFCSGTPCMKPKCIGKTKDSRQETNNLEHTLLGGNETWTSILIVSQSKTKWNVLPISWTSKNGPTHHVCKKCIPSGEYSIPSVPKWESLFDSFWST